MCVVGRPAGFRYLIKRIGTKRGRMVQVRRVRPRPCAGTTPALPSAHKVKEVDPCPLVYPLIVAEASAQ